MYQITRKNRIKEQLQLCNADGSVGLTLDVDLDVDKVVMRVNKAYDALGEAQNALQKAPQSQEAMEAYGKAFIAVLNVVFGEEGAKQLLEFYEGNYSELLLDIAPFLTDEIMPKIREASAARKAQLVDVARRAQKQNKHGIRDPRGRW